MNRALLILVVSVTGMVVVDVAGAQSAGNPAARSAAKLQKKPQPTPKPRPKPPQLVTKVVEYRCPEWQRREFVDIDEAAALVQRLTRHGFEVEEEDLGALLVVHYSLPDWQSRSFRGYTAYQQAPALQAELDDLGCEVKVLTSWSSYPRRPRPNVHNNIK